MSCEEEEWSAGAVHFGQVLLNPLILRRGRVELMLSADDSEMHGTEVQTPPGLVKPLNHRRRGVGHVKALG